MGFWLLVAGLAMGAGDGTVITTIPDGVDYRATDSRPHYSVTDSRPHYRATDNRPYYKAN